MAEKRWLMISIAAIGRKRRRRNTVRHRKWDHCYNPMHHRRSEKPILKWI